MTSLLRSLIASPRLKHTDSKLDLCYVTPFLIATSGPSGTYPQRAYRNPLDQLVAYLDKEHGDGWLIFEFRAEGTGYPDSEVRGKVRHYPWPDHHPPPFKVVPLCMGAMRNWMFKEQEEALQAQLKDGQRLDSKNGKNRVVVVHCKAGKGRSGTMAASFLMSECNWSKTDALARFSERRMRPGFGSGVSIPSQVRYVDYVERWIAGGKRYTDRPVEILEIHVWGLRQGVKVAVEGYIEDGRKIHCYHVFKRSERMIVEGDAPGSGGWKDWVKDMASPVTPSTPTVEEKSQNDKRGKTIQVDKLSNLDGACVSSPEKLSGNNSSTSSLNSKATGMTDSITLEGGKPLPRHASKTAAIQKASTGEDPADPEHGGRAVIFRPNTPVIVEGSDINIDFERRNRSKVGLAMVTSVAHVWFNTFFEGNGPEQEGKADDNGIFSMDWDAMDGIKGSYRKGTRAFDRMSVVWRVATTPDAGGANEVKEPGPEESVPDLAAADWKGGNAENPAKGRDLGLKTKPAKDGEFSEASSVPASDDDEPRADDTDLDFRGVKTSVTEKDQEKAEVKAGDGADDKDGSQTPMGS